jgi:hypothetical protein
VFTCKRKDGSFLTCQNTARSEDDVQRAVYSFGVVRLIDTPPDSPVEVIGGEVPFIEHSYAGLVRPQDIFIAVKYAVVGGEWDNHESSEQTDIMRQVKNTDTLVRVTPLRGGVAVHHEELREQIKSKVMIYRTANEIGSEHI